MPATRPAEEKRGVLFGLAEQPYLLLPITMLLWSGNMVMARGVADAVPPLALAQLRWSLAFVILLPLAWPHLRADLPTLLARWRIVAVLGALGVGGYNTLVYVGLQSTTAVNATVLTSIFPMVIAAAGFVLYRDRLTPAQFLGIVIATVGALVVLTGGDLGALLAFRFNPGDLWVLAAQVTYALYTVKLRERPSVHPLSFLVGVVFAGQLVLVPFSVGEALAGRTEPFTLTTVVAVVYTAVFASVIAYLCYNRGVAILGSNRAGPFFHLVPIFGSLMGVAFLGETVGVHHVVGWFMILGGIAAAQMGRREGAIR